jgi:transglutaminase-like putative cysteine protease
MGIPDGRDGVIRTLALMRALVRSRGGATSMVIRQLALRLVAGLRPKDYVGEVHALHRFVRDGIRYVRDIRGVETVQTPERTLENGQGDCDDKSTLLASLLQAIGHAARFEAVGFGPGQWSHVLVSAKLPDGSWLPLETTVPGAGPGWYPPRVVERLVMGV